MISKATQLTTAVALCLLAMGAQAATVTKTFAVSNASLTHLYSGTLDNACTTAGGQFFICTDVADVLGKATTVVISQTNTNGGGTLVLEYDDSTGEISSVDLFNVTLADISIFLDSATLGQATVIITSPNGTPGGATDVPRVLAGTAGANGSTDADQVGGPVFGHDAPGGEIDATGFSTFTDIVDSCTPVGTATVCFLIPVLAIDGLRYQLTGLVPNGGGAFSLALRSETANNSNYFIDIDLAQIPVPAAVWLFGSALGLLGWMRRRAA